VFGIWVLVTKSVEFVISVRLAASFLKVLVKRSVDWRGCYLLGHPWVILKCFWEFYKRTGELMLFLLDVWSDGVVWLDLQTVHLVAEQPRLLGGCRTTVGECYGFLVRRL